MFFRNYKSRSRAPVEKTITKTKENLKEKDVELISFEEMLNFSRSNWNYGKIGPFEEILEILEFDQINCKVPKSPNMEEVFPHFVFVWKSEWTDENDCCEDKI